MQDPQTHETYVYDHAEVRQTVEAADPEAGPWPIHGVAVADGDVLHDGDGNPVLMTAEELASADYSPAAKKLTVDHPAYEGASPPVEDTVGNNSMQYSDDGRAVVYDATTHDESIAAGVNGKTYGVSIHAGFRTGEPDPETGIPIARDIVFHDLSVVSLGDSPSNTAQYGGRSDVAAWARSGGLEAALSETETHSELPDTDDETVGLLRGLRSRIDSFLEAEATGDSRSGESGRGADTDSEMQDRETDIEFITANSHFTEEMLADMNDSEVEETRDLVDDEDDEDADKDKNAGADAPGTLGEMTPDQLGDVLRDQGFVTQDDVDQQVEASRTAASKGEQVDEIIAESEDYGEDDREDLMASPPRVVENIHKDATAPGAAGIPGIGGARRTAEAAIGSDEKHSADEFTTGVSR